MTDDQKTLDLQEVVEHTKAYIPLASRMRPKILADIVGQNHIFGENCLLANLIKNNTFGSLLFYGPPGCGKTTVAEIISRSVNCDFVKINAVLSNVSELREIINRIKNRNFILFIDEIHRFNKAQQDLLLPDMESGAIRLIGATTYNPGFYVISPLLSRSQLVKFEPIDHGSMVSILQKALTDEVMGLKATGCSVDMAVLNKIASVSDGDLRRALNQLEAIVMSVPSGAMIDKSIFDKMLRNSYSKYDADEDEHYDTISAFIKSIRGCDPDAAIYWLAKMLAGGEDPRFIARRLVIAASEDVGLADSRALPLAMACFDACEKIGLPECRINLAQVTIFLASAPKSNSAYLAIDKAVNNLKENGAQPIPLWLRDSHGSVSKDLGNGSDYLYSHEFPNNISGQEYMILPEQFYFPKKSGSEQAICERLAELKSRKLIIQSRDINKP
ncbi:MAG: replication-associated recombination protein A [Puniceicoccales bacterium]|jgi:putative ATPase|nr:replication-associated recombination protein A [Puniceicoccales bacterium]